MASQQIAKIGLVITTPLTTYAMEQSWKYDKKDSLRKYLFIVDVRKAVWISIAFTIFI